jgi:uncharacterized membrane protein (UPF0136 family)
MDKMPTFHLAAVALTAIYGLVSLVGGTIGYLKANSVASLVAGGLAGVLLLLCAAGTTRWPFGSLMGAVIVSLVLVAPSLPRFWG